MVFLHWGAEVKQRDVDPLPTGQDDLPGTVEGAGLGLLRHGVGQVPGNARQGHVVGGWAAITVRDSH